MCFQFYFVPLFFMVSGSVIKVTPHLCCTSVSPINFLLRKLFWYISQRFWTNVRANNYFYYFLSLNINTEFQTPGSKISQILVNHRKICKFLAVCLIISIAYINVHHLLYSFKLAIFRINIICLKVTPFLPFKWLFPFKRQYRLIIIK